MFGSKFIKGWIRSAVIRDVGGGIMKIAADYNNWIVAIAGLLILLYGAYDGYEVIMGSEER